jgi:hypothetical protein
MLYFHGFFMLIMFSIFTVLSMTSDAKQCVVPHPELGPCNLEACGAYCYKTYTNGSGHCAQVGGSYLHPIYQCFCSYICSN